MADDHCCNDFRPQAEGIVITDSVVYKGTRMCCASVGTYKQELRIADSVGNV